MIVTPIYTKKGGSDMSFVHIFRTTSPHWPQPMYEFEIAQRCPSPEDIARRYSSGHVTAEFVTTLTLAPAYELAAYVAKHLKVDLLLDQALATGACAAQEFSVRGATWKPFVFTMSPTALHVECMDESDPRKEDRGCMVPLEKAFAALDFFGVRKSFPELAHALWRLGRDLQASIPVTGTLQFPTTVEDCIVAIPLADPVYSHFVRKKDSSKGRSYLYVELGHESDPTKARGRWNKKRMKLLDTMKFHSDQAILLNIIRGWNLDSIFTDLLRHAWMAGRKNKFGMRIFTHREDAKCLHLTFRGDKVMLEGALHAEDSLYSYGHEGLIRFLQRTDRISLLLELLLSVWCNGLR